MKRGWMVMVLALSGCMSVNSGPEMSGPMCQGSHGPRPGPAMVPGVQGAWGQSQPMAAPYAAGGAPSGYAAAMMMSRSVPLNMMHMSAPGNPSGVVPAQATGPGGVPNMAMPPGGMIAPPGVPFGPGMMPPGGPMMAQGAPPPGAVAAVGAMHGPPAQPFTVGRTQVRFVRPSGMKVSWLVAGPDGKPGYANGIEAPGRYNFLQAAIYRLKLGNIEGRPGLEVYPTLEVVPGNLKTAAFLAHSAVPLEFTKEDFDQIGEGNYVVKVIYLPDPANQEQATTGIDQIISTRLEPGANPITEALRRGSILLVVRMGNVDQEAPNTPPIDAPGPHSAPKMPPGMPMPPMGPGMPPPGRMVPYMGPGAPSTGPGVPMMGPFGPGMQPAPQGGPNMQPAPGAPAAPQPPASGPQSRGPSVPLSRPSVFSTPPTPAQLATQDPTPPAKK
jgi:hypothetical protein